MLNLVVTRLTHEAEGVRGLELRDGSGASLPTFAAGAHVDVHLPGGICRQYSLTNDPQETDRYCLGVGLAAQSRGGSRYVHGALAVGTRLQVSEPRSLFGIEASGTEHIFVAGGIGITPILSMIRWCIRKGETWRLLYCVRSRARAAYLWDLAPHQGRVQLHVDEECAGRYPDVLSFLREAAPGAHVYCCGPGALMDAVARGASDAGIQATATHFERFTAEPRSSAGVAAESSFTVTLKRHGGTYTVEPGVSILQTLEQNGVALPFSCREGLCRTCEVPLLEGEAEHRDYVLSDDEHAANTTILICVSRARSPSLVLDV